MPLDFLGNRRQVGKGPVDIGEGKVESLEVAVLFLKSFLFRSGGQQPRYNQQEHNGIGVVPEFLMPCLVPKEPVET